MQSVKARENLDVKEVASTRRRFLQGTGTAVAVGLGSTGLLASKAFEKAVLPPHPGFSRIPGGFVYLNNGTEGSMPDCVLAAFQQGLEKWASDPTTSYEADPVYGKRQELNRGRVADFLGVGKNNICLTDNTTMGLSMTLMGLNFSRSDRVVTTNHEHKAIKSPLRVLQARIGLRVEERSFPQVSVLSRMSSNQVLDALFPDVPALRGAKALCVSHVYPGTGLRLPLKALRAKANELGISYLIVDGAQAMGMVELAGGDDVQHTDFYACAGHKWLNGPPSTGILYIRNADICPPEFYPTLSQRMGKYAGGADQPTASFPMAEALQVRGCSNTPGFAGMVRAMEFVEEEGGPAKIADHILGLAASVRDFVLSRAPSSLVSPRADKALHSGFTVFFPFSWDNPSKLYRDKVTADRVVEELLARNIQVRSIGFEDSVSTDGGSTAVGSTNAYALRVSSGHFNTAEHVETFTFALKEVLMNLS